MRIDLHTHTLHSDGLMTVSELVRKAADRKIQLLALTDHDTTAGISECARLCASRGVPFIPGIEMSTNYRDLDLHILALNPHANLTALTAHLDIQIQKRKERAREAVAQLTRAGFLLPPAQEKKLFALRNIGKPHMARAFLSVPANKKLAAATYRCPSTVGDFISMLLDKEGQVGYVRKERMATSEAIALIHTTGAVAVLAHPQFDLPKNPTRKIYCDDLKDMGLNGIEAVNGRRHLEQRADFAKLAVRYGWFMTAGSDTHDHTRLGVNVSTSMYAALKELFS